MADQPRGGWGPQHQELATAAGFPSWEAWIASEEKRLARQICGRITNRQRPHPCGRHQGAGTKHGKRFGPCSRHGGDSLAGPEHGAYVHGRKMDPKYRLAGNLALAYERLEASLGDAFSMEADARLLDARMTVLVESLDADPATPRALRMSISEARRAVQAALAPKATKGQKQAAEDALKRLDERLGSALVETQVWEDWRRLVEQKRKMADTKARQDAREHGPVLWQDVVMVTERVRQIILEHVPEGGKSEVLKAFRAMLERPAGV